MFTFSDLAEIGACVASVFTMLFVLVRNRRHLSAQMYVGVAVSSGVMWLLYILIASQYDVLSYTQQGLLVSSLSIATTVWMLFLLIYAREPIQNIFRRRSLSIYALSALLILASIGAFAGHYFSFAEDDTGDRFVRVYTLGKYFLVLFILANAFALLQIESTYRASQGALRRSIMPSLLLMALMVTINLVWGMMGLLLSRIEVAGIQLAALLMIAAMVMISRFVVYEEQAGQRVVVSREAVYSSVALVLIGVYFILIGGAVKLLVSLGGSPQVFLSVIAAFVLIVFFVAMAFSASIRNRWRGLVDRSIYSGKADLLTEITTFAENVTAATDRHEMFAIVDAVLSERCGLQDIRVYMRGSQPGEMYQNYPKTSMESVEAFELEQFLFRIGKMTASRSLLEQAAQMSDAERAFAEGLRGYELIPLVARKEFVGFIAGRAEQAPGEDIRFLIDSISHQLALSLLSAKQSEALIETRELASFTKVSSFVIHDVKNLISMLSMILQNAERKSDDPRLQQMTSETLRNALDRMRRLIGRLSTPVEQAEVGLSHCDLREIVIGLVEEMKLSSHSKIQTIVEINGVPPVRANDEKLRSVLSNLILNAIEAMPGGGELRINGSSDSSSVWIAVVDSGSGMTPEFMRERLFRPFQTSKPRGLGIGLFQSRELVEQMGGNLSATSTPGEGSCFKLKLRRA